MRTTTIRLAGLLAASLAMLAAGETARAQGAFKPLFNGKDLTGWVTPDDKSLFSVEDGVIVGRTAEKQLKKNEFLVSDRSYKNFILKVKLKLRNHNSGIQVRSKRAPDGAVSGPQADAADGYWGLLYEERGRQILDRSGIEKAAKVVKKDDWNDYVITFKGKHLTVVFNGVTVIDREDEKFADEGIIAFQVHAGPPMEVRFKDIEIEELP